MTKILYNIGVWRALNTYWGADRLTVLAYHRITERDAPGFDFFEGNVSASPDLFARQMAFVAKHFNVISVDDLEAYVIHKKPLPPRPLLITFDDGYLDNYEHARPVLKQHNFPAVIFLMTEGMTGQTRAWWDTCAYYFHHTTLPEAKLPLVGHRTLGKDKARRKVRDAFVKALKAIPNDQKLTIVAELSKLLDVPPPQSEQIYVTWDQVRELVDDGIACQPHTVHHPILSRIGQDQLYAELRDSRDEIAQQTGQDIVAFAYPNGWATDYNQAALDALEALDYRLAFTLEPGPMRLSKVRERPMEIQRVYLSQHDTFETFALKTMGLSRIRSTPEFVGQEVPKN